MRKEEKSPEKRGGKGIETKWSVSDIQKAIVCLTHNDVSIPNVSFGFFKGIECDLLQVTGTGYLREFEIKRSWSDFMADFRKLHFHDDVRIRQLTFVLPESFAGERLKKFCADHYQEFKREFDFMFYLEEGDSCSFGRGSWQPAGDWRSEFVIEERFRTSTYITDEMMKVVRANDKAAPYRRHLFTEELASLYRLGVIRLWHRTDASEKSHQDGEALDFEDEIDVAIKKPRRNCDAGTVEELLVRHSRFCAEQKEFAKSMGGDPALCVMNTCRECFAKWMLARWPEEEENGHKQ